MTKRFLVVYEVGENNYSGFAPEVAGCAAIGVDLEGMRQNMREALEFHLEGMAQNAEPFPEPVTTVVDFAEERPEDGVSHCVVEWVEIALPLQKKPVPASGDPRQISA
jgi:predicted RNase H-like HicB family nuclease